MKNIRSSFNLITRLRHLSPQRHCTKRLLSASKEGVSSPLLSPLDAQLQEVKLTPSTFSPLSIGRQADISYGVFRENEKDDVDFLVENFTAPALARALRVREQTLQMAAHLAESDNIPDLRQVLRPFLKSSVQKRRGRRKLVNIHGSFSRRELIFIQRTLQNMPREVFQAAEKRASVVIPICGMVEDVDATVIQTSLREMEEETGIPIESAEVLGILRCNWEEVAAHTGIAVTPVVAFIGDIKDITLRPNPDEVEQVFTVPISDLLDEKNWLIRDFSAPVFTGGPFVVWGLTAFLLRKFLKDVILRMNITSRTSLI